MKLQKINPNREHINRCNLDPIQPAKLRIHAINSHCDTQYNYQSQQKVKIEENKTKNKNQKR